MSDFDQLEARLASGDHVRLQRREAQDVLQKLRARGGQSDAADRIEAQLAQSDEVELVPGDAAELLEELRASGRRWVFGRRRAARARAAASHAARARAGAGARIGRVAQPAVRQVAAVNSENQWTYSF